MPPRFRQAVIAGVCLLPILTGCATGSNAGSDAASSRAPEDAAMTFPVEVAPQTMRCTGTGPRDCLQIRRSPNGPWELFYDTIVGFDFQPGFRYRLVVEQVPVSNPPADAPSVKWKLVEVTEKRPA